MRKDILYGICKTSNGYNGFAPDYPGCLVAAATLEEVQKRLPVALESHIQAMLEDDDPMPGEVENLVAGGVLRVDVREPVA
jgi:predicted RNase H-like HicB family nuclease